MTRSVRRQKEKVRLQKYLAECGVASRRRAEELITSGEVVVNNEVVAKLGTQIDPARDQIKVSGRIIRPFPKGVILFHKPVNVISTMNDPEGRRCIANFLTPRYRSYFPVGRLDWESRGLIVLTNDGEMAERLLHPRYQFERTYQVKVEGRVPDRIFAEIERGVSLEDGVVKAKVQFIKGGDDSTSIEVTLTEGRNRIVRRLFDHFGHTVLDLKRLSHGPFKLGSLKAGEIKKLSEREYHFYRQKVLRH